MSIIFIIASFILHISLVCQSRQAMTQRCKEWIASKLKLADTEGVKCYYPRVNPMDNNMSLKVLAYIFAFSAKIMTKH